MARYCIVDPTLDLDICIFYRCNSATFYFAKNFRHCDLPSSSGLHRLIFMNRSLAPLATTSVSQPSYLPISFFHVGSACRMTRLHYLGAPVLVEVDKYVHYMDHVRIPTLVGQRQVCPIFPASGLCASACICGGSSQCGQLEMLLSIGSGEISRTVVALRPHLPSRHPAPPFQHPIRSQ